VDAPEVTSDRALADSGEVAALRERSERATRRYLDLLADALLDEHYLENELRIEYLLECIEEGDEVDLDKLVNPARHMTGRLRELRREREGAELRVPRPGGKRGSAALAYTGLGRVRLDHLEACLKAIRDHGVEGDLVECGPGRGGAAIFMRGFLEAHELAERRVWVIDRFDGRAPTGTGGLAVAPDLNAVRDGFARFHLLDECVVFRQGEPAHALSEASVEAVALLRVALADPVEVRAVLETGYDRVAPGGFVVIDGYGAPGCAAAVEGFRSDRDVVEALERVDWGAAVWRKGLPEGHGARRTGSSARAATEEITPTATKELSVVVVFYNMRREARRTLHSLSRSYQRGVEDLDYEVIVVDNGSDPDQRLGEDFVRSFGPEFRYIDLGDEATPSPASAVNRGIAPSEAEALALMIDGAHVLTPGVLRFGMLGLATYAPAIVTAKQWYVGPGQQPEMVAGGYDRELEDRLFDEIEWPSDGYRLFEIGHFIGDRDWFDGEWESNCIFVPRALLEQAGGMDESFSVPGGGFVNLDFFERMVGTPGVTQVTMLGEGSFHQVHGGTTTNLVDPDELIRSFDDQYEELRGRRFQVPAQRAHFVGTLAPAARRTKPRRMNPFKHFKNAHIEASDRRPSRPAPVPQELKTEFIDAFWRSGEWHHARWLGKPIHRAPTDLFVYQELIFARKPDWVIETRTGTGGRALFLASICDLIGKGQVLTIDDYPLVSPPEHPRITSLRAAPAADRTAAEVREIVGPEPDALVILGGAAGPQVQAAFQNLAPLVPIGSYVVVEDTILGGYPVWPAFGFRPWVTVPELGDEGEFAPDPSLERLALTFNVDGFLKRVR
jgi:cephalosporin hydroxylase